MSAFFKPARSLQRLSVYKRPQVPISICNLQCRHLETSSSGASAKRSVRLINSQRREKIINHDYFVKDVSKIPLGYAFIPSTDVAIANTCRDMAREQKKKIFACVRAPTDSHHQPPSSTKVKKGRKQPAFGLYVPSDIADTAAIQFYEETQAIALKQTYYINHMFPHMPRKHVSRMISREYRRLKRWEEQDRKAFLKGVRWTMELGVKAYVKGYTNGKGRKLTTKEVELVMKSWKDGSKMPDIESLA